jgi:O-antigen/teichoic acid export membrane protein
MYSALAAIATGLVLVAAAGPLARILYGDGGLERLVQVAAAYGVTLIFFEMLKGAAMGLLDFRSVLWLSTISGVMIAIGLALSASISPSYMLLSQAVAVGTAVVLTFIAGRRTMMPLPYPSADRSHEDVKLKEIVTFGAAQLGAGIGISAASWIIAVLVTRSGSGTEQVGLYAVGNQLNSLVQLAPLLVAQLVFPLMGRFENAKETQDRVVEVSTFLTSAAGLVGGGALLLVLPLFVEIYGSGFSAALFPGTFLVATGMTAVSSTSAANALMILKVRSASGINALWSVTIVALAAWLVPLHGAAGAGAAWYGATILSGTLVMAMLARLGRLPKTAFQGWYIATLASSILGGLTLIRFARPEWAGSLLLLYGVSMIAFLGLFLYMTRRTGFLQALPRSFGALKSLFLSGKDGMEV